MVNPPYDALDEAGHLYGYLFSEPLIRYPKLVLEPFIPGPLQEKREKKFKKINNRIHTLTLSERASRRRGCAHLYMHPHILIFPFKYCGPQLLRVIESALLRGGIVIRYAESAIVLDEECWAEHARFL
jgi:hypothetical protein